VHADSHQQRAAWSTSVKGLFLLVVIVQVASFKGYVQSPNNFFQLPFMSAIAREVSRYYLQTQGRLGDAKLLEWQPRLAAFPHPELSPGAAGYLLPPFVFLACMFSTVSMISMLVSEKETGLRQALRTMGLLQGSYWFSWWLFEAVMAAINAWIVTGFGAIWQQHAPLWSNSMLMHNATAGSNSTLMQSALHAAMAC